MELNLTLELLKELAILNEKTKNKHQEKVEMNNELKNLDMELKKTEEMMEKVTNLTPISVDENHGNYNLMNGLVDANRDIVMKLLMIIKDETKLRNIIGMGKIFYVWSKQPIFQWVLSAYKIFNRINFLKKFFNIFEKLLFRGLTIIYQATKDGFKVADFHAKCDNKGATLVITKTSEGYMFGGYAAVPWNSSGGVTRDESGESFLYSIFNPRNSLPEKFVLLKKSCAIFRSPYYGPCFGYVDALVCYSDSNINSYSYAAINGKEYAIPVGLDGKTLLTGNEHFTASEIIVFQVRGERKVGEGV